VGVGRDVRRPNRAGADVLAGRSVARIDFARWLEPTGLSDGGVMNRNVLRSVLTIAGAALIASPVNAHHSFAAAFDENKPVSVTGVVTEVRLENPHSWFYVDVTDEAGRVTKWGFEGNTPTSLIRAGYRRDAVKVGDKVTIKGSRARDPSATMGAAREIILQDGRTFVVGPKGAADAY
jgi:hypothetical protein